MAIDFTKPVRTRNGCKVRIYATDGAGDYPIHGATLESDGWQSERWMADGRFLDTARQTGEWDLVQADEPAAAPEPKEWR